MFNIDKTGKKIVEKKFSATGCFISVVIWVVLGFLVIIKIGPYKKFPWEKSVKKIIINTKTLFLYGLKAFWIILHQKWLSNYLANSAIYTSTLFCT